MTDHPITPPPELRRQWQTEVPYQDDYAGREHWLIDRAAQWGADQELETCIAWLVLNGYGEAVSRLRAARRPKPPSLKKQALKEMDKLDAMWDFTSVEDESLDTIRRALEGLPDG